MVATRTPMGARKKAADKRDVQLKVMVTREFADALEEAASEWGMTPSEYVRLAVEEKKRRDACERKDSAQ